MHGQILVNLAVRDLKRSRHFVESPGCESRAQVEALFAKAIALGATRPRPPQDHGFMYQDAYTDHDGHIWELVHMSPAPPAAEIRERVLPLLPDALFPGGATAGWWIKGVQLDLEARDVVVREKTKPLRWRKV